MLTSLIGNIDISACNLTQIQVDEILSILVAMATWGNSGEICNLAGGTNAAPSGSGLADKATLIGRGATVNTN